MINSKEQDLDILKSIVNLTKEKKISWTDYISYSSDESNHTYIRSTNENEIPCEFESNYNQNCLTLFLPKTKESKTIRLVVSDKDHKKQSFEINTNFTENPDFYLKEISDQFSILEEILTKPFIDKIELKQKEIQKEQNIFKTEILNSIKKLSIENDTNLLKEVNDIISQLNQSPSDLPDMYINENQQVLEKYQQFHYSNKQFIDFIAIDNFPPHFPWNEISKLQLSDHFLELTQNHIIWNNLIKFSPTISDQTIEKFKQHINFHLLNTYRNIPISFYEKYKEQFDSQEYPIEELESLNQEEYTKSENLVKKDLDDTSNNFIAGVTVENEPNPIISNPKPRKSKSIPITKEIITSFIDYQEKTYPNKLYHIHNHKSHQSKGNIKGT
jgi:hypothetical protein